jgi:hypothetical protein
VIAGIVAAALARHQSLASPTRQSDLAPGRRRAARRLRAVG